jgi:ribonucleoside-diphosphate reductase alpha chain
MLSYTRKKKGNPGDKNFRVDSVDQSGDSFEHFEVLHHGLAKWKEVNPDKTLTSSPYHGATAHDINWVNKIRLQAAIQKHCDNSISVTTNLPEDVKEEEVSRIYLQAWKLGCKGCTIYRDKSRTGILVSSDDKAKPKQEKKRCCDAPKRPPSLPANMFYSKVKGVAYVVIVGLHENDPYEIFAGRASELDLHNIKDGYIVKNKRGHYAIHNKNDEPVLDNITELIDDTEEALTRMTSTSLRHGIPLEFIVSQLEKITGDIQSFGKVLARALKKYIQDGTKVVGGACKDCGGELIRQEGCQTCRQCGWSKCG